MTKLNKIQRDIMETMTSEEAREFRLGTIAQDRLGLVVLETCGNDDLDFSTHAIWEIAAALRDAFAAGVERGYRDNATKEN